MSHKIEEYANRWDREAGNNFAVACYDMNSLSELRDAAAESEADPNDVAEWELTGDAEWREAIAAAYSDRLVDDR